MRKKTSNSIIGLDIGSDFLKLAELKETSAGKQLLNLGIAGIPALSSQKNSRLSAISQAIEALKETVPFSKLETRQVILSISAPEILYRDFSLPFMPKEELKKAVALQVGRTDPHLLKNAAMDFSILTTSVDERGAKMVDLIVTAASSEVVEGYLSVVKRAGLKPIGIGLKIFALAESIKINTKEEKDQVTVLVNIGAQKTIIAILKDKDICFVRQVELGGRNITEAISEGLNIDFKQAEELKIKYGIPQEPEEDFEKNIGLFMRAVLERFLVEIGRFLGYYSQRVSKKRVDKIVLCGGGAGLKNIDKILNMELGVPVEIYNPLEGVIQPETFRLPSLITNPQLTAAMGLTQRGVIKKVNLLPSQREELKRKINALVLKQGLFKIIAPFFAALLLLIYLVLITGVVSYRKKIEVIKRKFAGLSDAQAKLRTGELIDEKVFLVTRLKQRLPWSAVLKDISQAIIADSVWLSRVHFLKSDSGSGGEKGTLKIWGSAFSKNLANEFVSRLSKSEYFAQVVLSNVKEATRGNYKIVDFEITCLPR